MQKDRKIQLNLIYEFSISALIAITFFIFGPIELYFNNSNILWFSLNSIIVPLIFCGALCFILTFFLCHFGRGNFKILICGAVFGIGVVLYLQGNFLNLDYGLLNGNDIKWNKYEIYGLLNCIIWLSILIGSVLVAFKQRGDKYKKVIIFISSILISVQLVTMIFLFFSVKKYEKSKESMILSKESMFEISTKENIIIFVLDTLDSSYFENYIRDNKEYIDKLEGFTYFPNAVSGGAPTALGLPLMLTGEHFYNNKDYTDYKDEAYSNSEIFKDLKKEDFDVRLYTDTLYLSNNLYKYVDNMSFDSVDTMNLDTSIKLIEKMYNLTAFRYFPHVFKKYFWFYSGEFNDIKIMNNSENLYVIDDSEFYNNLLKNNLEINSKDKIFRLYHLFGAHSPFTMDENCNRVEKTSIENQIEGVLKIVFEYIDLLKEKKLYDNTSIVITADHGGKELFQNPTVLVKPKHKMDTFNTNNSYIGFIDFPATVASFFKDDYKNYGKSYYDIKNLNREFKQIVIKDLAENFSNKKYSTNYIEYRILGDPKNADNIVEIGETKLIYKEIMKYNLGDTIDFSQFGNANEFAFFGFSGQEEKGMWTDGNEAIVKMKISDNIVENIILNMSFIQVFNNTQRMELYVNDVFIEEKSISENNTSFLIPRECLSDNTSILEIKFKFKDMISPNEIGMVGDRKLAFFFKDMTLKYNKD